jgi:hypothetical protein
MARETMRITPLVYLDYIIKNDSIKNRFNFIFSCRHTELWFNRTNSVGCTADDAFKYNFSGPRLETQLGY